MRVTAHRLQGIYQEDHECVVDIYTAFQNALVKRSLSLFWREADCVIQPSFTLIISLYYKLLKTRLDFANIFSKSECRKYFNYSS